MIDCLSIIQRYYTPGNEDYRVLVLHSRQVADLAVRLGQRLIDHGEPLDLEFVEEAALLHDIGMCRTYAPGIHCHGTAPYIQHGIIGKQMLESMGLYRHARVCERHTGAGITADEIISQQLPIEPPRDLLPETLEEKLVCYADKFFSKSRPDEPAKTLERARLSLAKFGGATLQRFDDLIALFGNPAEVLSD